MVEPMSRTLAPSQAAPFTSPKRAGEPGETMLPLLGDPHDPVRGEEQDITIQTYTLNFGPQHPTAHGVLRLAIEPDGKVIERIDPYVGFLHRGTEKFIENKPYLLTIPNFDQLHLRKSQPYDVYARMDFDVPRQHQRRLLRPVHGPRRGPLIGQDHEERPGTNARGAGRQQRHQGTAAEPHRDEPVDGSDLLLSCSSKASTFPGARCTSRRTPQGFSHLQATDFMTKGNMLADVTAVLGSIDIVSAGRSTSGVAARHMEGGETCASIT